MTRLCQYIIFLLCCLCAVYSHAADSVQYQHYTIDNGLPSNNVYSCLQDHNGYLWITTDHGLLKYNGYTFKIFNTGNSGIPDNDVFRLYEDKAGRIWIYTLTRNFGYISNDKYHEVHVPGMTPERYHANAIQSWDSVTCYDNMYFKGGGMIVYKDTGHAVILFLPYRIEGISRNGTVFVSDKDGIFSLNIFTPLKPIKRICRLPVYKLSEMAGYRKAKMLSDSFLFFVENSYNKDVCRIDLQTQKADIIHLPFEQDEYLYTYVFETNPHLAITNKHVYYFDNGFHFFSRKRMPGFIKEVQVSYEYTDRNKDTWYGSNGGGLWQQYNIKALFQSDTSLRKMVNSRFVGNTDHRFSYWWDSKKLSLMQLDDKNQLKEWILKGRKRVNSISAYNDSNIILCQEGNPLFNIYTGRMASDEHYDMTARDRGWVQGIKLLIYRRQDRKFFADPFGIRVFKISDGRLSFLKSAANDRYDNMDSLPMFHKLVFFNLRSLVVYDLLSDSSHIIPTEKSGINRIVSLKHDRWGNIYILTEEKFILFNPYTFRWRTLLSRLDLTNAHIDVTDDKLLLVGRFGAAAASITGPGSLSSFAAAVNIKDNYFKQVNGAWISGDHLAILQTDKSIYRIDLDSLLLKGIHFEQGNIGRFSFTTVEPYNKTFSPGDTLQFLQEYNHLTIGSINFYGNGIVQYNYTINTTDGTDSWQQSTSGEISLANIHPGTYYHLKIKAADEVWKSGVTDVLLYITPYWYQTHNARVSFLIAGTLILILAVIGIISLARQAVLKAQTKRRNLTELELRAVYSQINPHFIFNTLSTALYFIDRKDYDNAYKHVNKFSHLLRSYLKSSHDRYILLSEEIDMLKRYIELQQTRFEDLFTYEIKVENRVPADHIQIPSLLLQPLVENAINHGLFHRKEQGGRLFISFTQGSNADELICMIEDNGIGRVRAMDLKKQNDAERISYGSKLTDKLVDIFRQYEAMNIHIQYIDKTVPETGTIVRLTIGNVKYVV